MLIFVHLISPFSFPYYDCQPTPHQQVRSRRSAYAPADDGEGTCN